jgi:hypothetical protein
MGGIVSSSKQRPFQPHGANGGAGGEDNCEDWNARDAHHEGGLKRESLSQTDPVVYADAMVKAGAEARRQAKIR